MASPLESMLRTRRRGGPTSVARFSRALGLEKAPPAYAVRDVSWVDDHVEVTVGAGGRREATLALVQRAEGVVGLASTERLVLQHRAGGLPRKLAQRVVRAAERTLSGASVERLAEVLADDPDLGPPASVGVAAVVEAPVCEPGPSEKELAGTRRAGGEQSRRRFAELLGLDGSPYEIGSLGWIQDHVETTVRVSDEREIRFALQRAAPDRRGLFVTRHLVLSYQAKDLPEDLNGLLLDRARSRLADATLDELARDLLADPDLGKPGEALPSAGHDHPANQLDTWGGADAYADFFAGGEIARSQLDSVDISRFSRNVQHCDAECLFVNPHSSADVVSMVCFPWEDDVRSRGVPRAERFEPLRDHDEDDAMVATDLTEQDVILGNPDKLRRVLEHVTRLPNRSRKPLFVANTCVPTVTGEDVESVVREYRSKASSPILYLTVTPKSMNDVLVDLLVDRRLEAERTAPPPDPRAVNLVGYAEGRAHRELEALLGRFGVRVNATLLPALDADILERLPRASLNVFLPNSLWAHLYEQISRDSRIPGITPAAPYGMDGTRRWVRTVLEALGVEGDHERTWQEHFAALEPAWRARTKRAGRHRLGIVVRGEEIQYLVDPAETWGVPLLDSLGEAGFGLDVFLAARDGRSGERVAERVREVLPRGEQSSIATFDSFEAMRTLLGDSSCGAILTHHFYDWRIGEAGKNRFSLQHFEPGPEGALRTVDRLCSACETPFFSRYRRYLGRTAEGLRAGAGGEAQ